MTVLTNTHHSYQAELFGLERPPAHRRLETERALAATCLALLDKRHELSAAERKIADSAGPLPADSDVEAIRREVFGGADPLGEAFSFVRSATCRRALGAVYTPEPIVASMVQWLGSQGSPDRVIDPGAGSGRFTLAAGRIFQKAHLVAIEMDPLAALMLRANLSVLGWNDRATVLVGDYRQVALPACDGATAFIGNPPYVRHHDIEEQWKGWYATRFAGLGVKASSLAGLHLHFFLQTCLLAKDGDWGTFVTSAEWMDVNYGAALRRLFLERLGGMALHVLEPTAEAFPGTATTAAVTCFRVGRKNESVRVRSVRAMENLNGLSQGDSVAHEALHAAPRWSIFVRPVAPRVDGAMELGELFRVHRGQVTGANGIWIAGGHANDLPERVKLPTVTKAKELFSAGAHLRSSQILRRVIDLPPDLDELSDDERRYVSAFLTWARRQGADRGYIATHRKAWWSVGLKAPAPILCTYMARRPPQFTLNSCDARHINVAHGLYPRESMPSNVMTRLVDWLNANTKTDSGRTYAGGLTKFEPKEIERLRIPSMQSLLS